MGEEVEQEGLAALRRVHDLGRYRLIAELARGGMGVVYLALVRGPGGFNKLFVVKELKTHLAEDPNLVRMFLEEARLAAKLSHPNVVQTIEIGSEGARHYIAMEHLDGQSLHRVIARGRKIDRPLPFAHFLYALASMLEGLHYAHELTDFDGAPLELVHRDVSPHNVFVTYDGQVKILDFGIAKALDSSHDTRTGVLKGKVAYMAPEQARGEAIDRRADVFSAGVMLFEAATGARMWGKAQNDLQILHALTTDNIPRPRDVKGDVDAGVERVVLKACAAKREDRYATAMEMQADVDGLLRSLGGPPFAARDVGRLVTEVFAPERARTKQVIDDQLRLLRGIASGEFVKVDLPQLTTTTLTGPSVAPPAMRGSMPPSGQPEASPASGPRSDAAPDSAARTIGAPPGPGSTLASSIAPPARRTGAALTLAAGALVLGCVAAFAVHRASAPTETPAAEPAASTPAPPAAKPIQVLVTVSPRDAKVSLDDGPPSTGTFAGTLPRDGRTHVLTLGAPKYEQKTLRFQADDDRTFDVSLLPSHEPAPPAPAPAVRWNQRRAAPPPAAVPPAPPMPAYTPPAAAPAPTPTAPARSRQQIDTSDPYAH